MEVQLSLGDALDDARFGAQAQGRAILNGKYVETHGSKILQDDEVEDEAFKCNSGTC
jgi:hypothetical protein